MTTSTSIRSSLISLALAALLTACGGGDDGTEGAVKFAGQMRAASVAAPMVAAAAATTVTADMTLDWAEYKFPALFPKAIALRFPNIEYGGVVYNARAYPGAWGMRYLGITPDGRIYGLGDFTGNALQQFNDIPYWSAQILGDQCNVYPGSCGNPPPGPLNECADPAVASLPTGFNLRLVYDYIGAEFSGEQTLEMEIDGPDNFETQSAIKVTTLSSSTNDFGGIPVTTSTKIESFEQVGSNGVNLSLGALVEVNTSGFTIGGQVFPGTRLRTKSVYNPARQNLEFHLALGQTGSITSTSTTTTLEYTGLPGTPPGPTTSTTTETFTFEAKETVDVPAGSYFACRYRQNGDNANSYTKSWYIVGKGVPVKSQTTVDGVVTDTQQLKSGTYNGASL